MVASSRTSFAGRNVLKQRPCDGKWFLCCFQFPYMFRQSRFRRVFLLVNDLVWFLCLVLKSSTVTPMYLAGSLLSVETSIGWYTALFVRHLPSVGHLSCCLQLHCRVSCVLSAFVCLVCLFSIFLFCLFMSSCCLSSCR